MGTGLTGVSMTATVTNLTPYPPSVRSYNYWKTRLTGRLRVDRHLICWDVTLLDHDSCRYLTVLLHPLLDSVQVGGLTVGQSIQVKRVTKVPGEIDNQFLLVLHAW